ncbi:transcriptional regulator [Gracilibacillus sp. HCP3S3_G5_1]|uniref:transcriptional regulator n=1 Tax=unclassified Gracilibacillus TaxID=2625209 RepID=UPI003F8A01C8
MTIIELQKSTFKKIEAEWFNYHHTLREIATLREAIENPFDEDPEEVNIVKGANSVREPGDPTGRIATRLSTNKQLKYLTEITDVIKQVYDALPDDYRKMVELRYWSKQKITWESIASEVGVSERQARRWRNEIVKITADQLGWR